MSYEFLKPGNSVNFNTKTNVLKTEYSGVKVLGIVSSDIAMTLQDVRGMHLQVKPYITGLPDLFSDYTYVIVQHTSGMKDVLVLPWLLESSIALSGKQSYQIIVDNIEPEQVEVIRKSLINRAVEIRSFTVFNQ